VAWFFFRGGREVSKWQRLWLMAKWISSLVWWNVELRQSRFAWLWQII
jgi:hypothetical protein